MGTPDEFWPNFSKADDDPLPSRCSVGSLASDVLTTFGIAHTGIAGGPLKNLDIKHMDAEQLIKLSLLDESSGSVVKEMIVDEYGLVNFKEIGGSGGLSGCTVYHQIQSATFIETCKGVMVTGGKPLPTRKKAEFKPIWGTGPKEIYNAFWVSENGVSEAFSQYATIVFNDPHLNTEYKDGIDNLYEINSPWESIIGYARYIDWPGSEDSPETTVERANTSTIPILISGDENNTAYNASLGTLQTKPAVAEVGGANLDSGVTAPAGDGIKVTIPDSFRYTTVRGSKLDKLIGIHSVIIVGRKVNTLIGIPSNDAAAVAGSGAKSSDAEIMAGIDSIRDSMYTLKAGDHYVISYQDDDPYVVFADNSRAFEPAKFGSGLTVKIDEGSVFGGQTLNDVSVLPTGGTDGYLVKQVIVLVNLQTPCINVYDPRPGKALEIANDLTYELCPLISEELPAPIAFNGSIIDQSEGVVDHDPTTQQNLTDTAYERAIDIMSGGGGMSVTLSFLDEDECANMSQKLFDHLNGGNGSVTTYVCGPDSTPELGGYGNDSVSIVNDIVYSYSDSNSYTISVTTGPRLLGDLGNITEGATTKMTENVPSTGRVVQDVGNHVHFKVLLDGCGLSPIIAINTAPKVIRVGDRVQCTVHNNPIEQ